MALKYWKNQEGIGSSLPHVRLALSGVATALILAGCGGGGSHAIDSSGVGPDQMASESGPLTTPGDGTTTQPGGGTTTQPGGGTTTPPGGGTTTPPGGGTTTPPGGGTTTPPGGGTTTSPNSPFTLSIAKSGSGLVTSSPAGINCGSDCSEPYADGSTVTLTAAPSAGYVFRGWGGVCAGTSTTCTVTMSAARNVNVSFESSGTAPGSIDEVIAAMAPNSWKSLPATQMKEVCPLPYNDYACRSVITAWSGGAYDQARDRMVVYGGGHGDSWYNNVFAFDLATMKWARLSEMAAGANGSSPGSVWNDKRTETCGFYPKGPLTLPDSVMTPNGYVSPDKCFVEPVLSQLDLQQPRSSHTYGGVFVEPLSGRYCSIGQTPSTQAGSQDL